MAPVNTVLPLILATMATLTAARPGPKFGPPHKFPGPFGGWGRPWEPIPIDDVLPEPATSSEFAVLTVSATSSPMVVGTATALTTASSATTTFQDASSVMVTVLTVTSPSTAAAAVATATAIDTSNPDWDPEASHCKDDDEECEKKEKELDEWIEEFTKTYRPTRTVDLGGYPIRATPTSLVARSETVKAVDIATATSTIIDTSNPDCDPEASHCKDDDEECKQMWKEGEEYYKELTKTYHPTRTFTPGGYPTSAIPTTMLTEFLKPQETKIAAPVGGSDVENIQCLGLDCGLSA